MFEDLEETNIAVYDMVLNGFKDTSGKCKSFIHEMGVLAIAFFAQAKEMEGSLAKCDARAFKEVMDASKDHVFHLIQEVADTEGILRQGLRLILIRSWHWSTAKEVKAYVAAQRRRATKGI